MSEQRSDHELDDIDRQLRELRDALGTLHAPVGHEQALRRALRDRLGATVEAALEGTTPVASEAPDAEHRPIVSRRVWRSAGYALAASLATVFGLWLMQSSGPAVDSFVDEPEAVVAGGSQRREAPSELAEDTLAEAPATVPPSRFEPLVYESAGIPLSQSYVVVRVRAPVSLLGLDQGASIEGTIEADMLIGEDGLVAGVRFDEAMFETAIR